MEESAVGSSNGSWKVSDAGENPVSLAWLVRRGIKAGETKHS